MPGCWTEVLALGSYWQVRRFHFEGNEITWTLVYTISVAYDWMITSTSIHGDVIVRLQANALIYVVSNKIPRVAFPSPWNSHSDKKNSPDNKVDGANMGPTWVLSAPGGPHVGPIDLAIRVPLSTLARCCLHMSLSTHHHACLWGTLVGARLEANDSRWWPSSRIASHISWMALSPHDHTCLRGTLVWPHLQS